MRLERDKQTNNLKNANNDVKNANMRWFERILGGVDSFAFELGLCALCSLVFFSVGHNMSESLAFFTIKMLNGDPENVPFRQFIVESP
jgi:hypothetical protein